MAVRMFEMYCEDATVFRRDLDARIVMRKSVYEILCGAVPFGKPAHDLLVCGSDAEIVDGIEAFVCENPDYEAETIGIGQVRIINIAHAASDYVVKMEQAYFHSGRSAYALREKSAKILARTIALFEKEHPETLLLQREGVVVFLSRFELLRLT